jgi:hypothetical protein
MRIFTHMLYFRAAKNFVGLLPSISYSFFFFFCICGQLIIKKIVFGTCIVSLISELSDNNSFAVYHILNIPLLLLQLLSGATLLGAMFCFSAFCFKSLYGFVALFSVGEILVFATQVSLSWYELVKNLI